MPPKTAFAQRILKVLRKNLLLKEIANSEKILFSVDPSRQFFIQNQNGNFLAVVKRSNLNVK